MATKRYITIPPNQILDGEELEFVRSVIEPLLEDNRWGQNRKAGRAAMRVEDAFEGKGPGDVVELAEDDWKTLVSAAENPQFGNPQAPSGYRPGMLRYLERWGWLDAITEAPKKDPREKEEEEEEEEEEESA